MTDTAEIETALLGALILDPSSVDAITDAVTAHDFADSDLGSLFDALVTLHGAGKPIGDAAFLVPELRHMGVPEAARTPAFIGQLLMRGTAAHARYYAQELRRVSRLRSLGAIGAQLAAQATAAQADPDKLAAWLDASVAGIGFESSDHCRRLGEVAAEFVAELKAPQARGRTVMTGLPAVDSTVGGFAPGELIVLAARTSIGKTALAMQIAVDVAARGRSVLFASLEMRDRELVSRVLCGAAGVNAQRIRSGRHDDRDVGQIEWAASKVNTHPLFIYDPPRATTARIRGQAKRVQAAHGLDLLICDYIGLVQPADRKRERYQQVGEITADLKALAKELGMPVLALAQLNREADGAAPKLSHLRESGSIEQDADIVWLLHRADVRAEDSTLIVAKHRHGQTGKLALRWVPARLRFESEASEF